MVGDAGSSGCGHGDMQRPAFDSVRSTFFCSAVTAEAPPSAYLRAPVLPHSAALGPTPWDIESHPSRTLCTASLRPSARTTERFAPHRHGTPLLPRTGGSCKADCHQTCRGSAEAGHAWHKMSLPAP